MVNIKTENVYMISDVDDLGIRPAEITLEDLESITNEKDTSGILYVAGGLKPRDQVVFLSFSESGNEELPKEPVGYLVSEVNEENGSGILVSGDLIEQHPKSYSNKRIEDTWSYLSRSGNSLEEFSLFALNEYIRIRQLKSKHLI